VTQGKGKGRELGNQGNPQQKAWGREKRRTSPARPTTGEGLGVITGCGKVKRGGGRLERKKVRGAEGPAKQPKKRARKERSRNNNTTGRREKRAEVS